jgi:hypothetical protein
MRGERAGHIHASDFDSTLRAMIFTIEESKEDEGIEGERLSGIEGERLDQVSKESKVSKVSKGSKESKENN